MYYLWKAVTAHQQLPPSVKLVVQKAQWIYFLLFNQKKALDSNAIKSVHIYTDQTKFVLNWLKMCLDFYGLLNSTSLT